MTGGTVAPSYAGAALAAVPQSTEGRSIVAACSVTRVIDVVELSLSQHFPVRVVMLLMRTVIPFLCVAALIATPVEQFYRLLSAGADLVH